MRTKEAESSVQPSAVNQVQPALPKSTTWAKLPDQTTFVVLNVIGLTLAIMCLTIQFAAVYHLMFRGSEEWVASIVVVSAGGTIASGGLMVARRPRRRCPHCDTDLLESPENPPRIWCPVCRSIFDPGEQGLPMKEAKVYLYYYLDHPDPFARQLAEILDGAISSRTKEVRFSAGDAAKSSDSPAPLAIAPPPCVEIRNAALYIEILAEFDRRARANLGEAVSTLEIIGTEHQATAIVSFAESAGARRATIRLRYPDHLPTE